MHRTLQVTSAQIPLSHLLTVLGPLYLCGVWRVLAWIHLPTWNPIQVPVSLSLMVVASTLKPFRSVTWQFIASRNQKGVRMQPVLGGMGSTAVGPSFLGIADGISVLFSPL